MIYIDNYIIINIKCIYIVIVNNTWILIFNKFKIKIYKIMILHNK